MYVHTYIQLSYFSRACRKLDYIYYIVDPTIPLNLLVAV